MVSIINSGCMEMVTILLFDTFKVRSIHIMMSMPVFVLTRKKHPTIKSNEYTLCVRNTYMKKTEPALVRSILVTVPVDTHFSSR